MPLVLLANLSFLWICHICEFAILACHTERSEVSINLRRILKFLWIFRFVLTHSAQNDEIRRHYKMTKCVFFVRHCERARRAWQSTNLNANLPLDCHEFARLRFANSRNDKTLVIPTCLCYPLLFLVILRYAQYDKK